MMNWLCARLIKAAAVDEPTGSSTMTFAPSRNHSVELLLLQRDIRVRVLINHSASGAKTSHLGLKAREIMLFIAR